jgi:hypothetical protein
MATNDRFASVARMLGVDEIVAMHAPIHETVYSDSTLENELIDAARLADDVAVVRFWSRLSADRHILPDRIRLTP